MPSDLFTTTSLGSYAGLVAATFLLVSFLKEPIKKLGDWYVRLLAVAIALAIQLFVQYVSGAVTVESAGLAVLNSFLIAIAAVGTYELTKPKVEPQAAPDASQSPTTDVTE